MGEPSWFWSDWPALLKGDTAFAFTLAFAGFATRCGDRPPAFTVALLGLHVEIPLGNPAAPARQEEPK